MEDNSEVFLENLQELESTTAPFVQRSLALQLYNFNSSIYLSEQTFLIQMLFFYFSCFLLTGSEKPPVRSAAYFSEWKFAFSRQFRVQLLRRRNGIFQMSFFFFFTFRLSKSSLTFWKA
jgi:hypothetical protein